MSDYSKTTWVEGVTQVGPTNLNKIEQGIADATKQAILVPGTGMSGTVPNGVAADQQKVVWVRSSDGGYVASHEAFESGSGATLVTTQQDRVDSTNNTNGAIARRVIEARTRGGAPIVTGIARLKLEATRGGRYKIIAETTAEATLDPNIAATILDDLGYSDFTRVTRGTYANRPAASTSNQGQFFFATDTKALYYNDDGTRWIQLAGPQEASSITTPATGWGTHYVNYNNSFRYWKDALGYVHVTGETNDDGTGLASLAANALVWSPFPAGYRPTSRIYVRGNGNPATNRFLINPSGEIRVDDNGANSTRYTNFGHFTFPTF